jgi:hypothetical protein
VSHRGFSSFAIDSAASPLRERGLVTYWHQFSLVLHEN